MAAPESPEDIARRLERERVKADREREAGLEDSLAPFRVGSVKYLNAVPLTRGIEDQVVFATPARLAELLRRDELDAALVSTAEVLLTNRYDILDGIAIASLGEVYSVLLAHRRPLVELKEVFCHTASLSGLNLHKGAAGGTRIDTGVQADDRSARSGSARRGAAHRRPGD